MSKSTFRAASRAAVLAVAMFPPLSLAQATQPAMPSGQRLFQDRCASCHGADAIGNGPAAAGLATSPADLTRIRERAGGTFPAARVVEVITYGGKIAAHGSGPMPVWGAVFSVEGGRGKIGAATSRRNVIALKRYLETIQK